MVEGSESKPQASYPPSVVAAEQRAREFIAQGKWRKARDEVKPLVKLDRAHFLPLLIEANTGLAREMIVRGQTSEARQVMAYLATIAPPEQLRAIELDLSAKTGDAGNLAPRFAAMLAESGASLPDKERIRLADQLVVAFHELPADSPALAAIAGEVRALQAGLAAVSEERYSEVGEILRPIARRSPFSHWVAFIKGLAAFHSGDGDRAERFFQGLPAESVPAKAGEAYLRLLGRADGSFSEKNTPAHVVEMVCRLAAGPEPARVLPRAFQLWREGRHFDSYKVLRQSIPRFPTLDPGWMGALTEYYFQAVFVLQSSQQERYLDELESLVYGQVRPGPVEEMLIRRVLALSDSAGLFVGELEEGEAWDEYLDARERLLGPNRRLKAVAYTKLGKRLAELCPSPFGFGGSSIRDARGAEKYLRAATNLDPGNLDAFMALCQYYEQTGEKPKRNRLLDEMTRRFPSEKSVLVEAAAHCVERKSYTKALGFLERARAVDRLDTNVIRLTVTALLRGAVQAYQKSNLAKARRTLDDLEPFLADKLDDLHLARWAALVRRGVLEDLFGEPSIAAGILARARESSPLPVAYLFCAQLAWRCYGLRAPRPAPFLPELQAETRKGPSFAGASLALRTYLYWKKNPDKPHLGPEVDWLRGYLRALARQPIPRAQAKEIIELIGTDGPGTPFALERRVIIQSVLRQDSRDPEFRLFQFICEHDAPPHPDELRSELAPILEEARKRGDHETIQRIQNIQRQFEHQPGPRLPVFPPTGMPGGVDISDDDEDDEEEVQGDDFPPEPSGGSRRAPEPSDIRQIMDLIAGMSPDELEAYRQSLPRDMPPEILDMFIQAARGGKPPRQPPSTGGGQMDLL